jgi:hypothetical protein
VETPSSVAATLRTRSLLKTKAGAIAFSRTGDPMLGEFSDAMVLFKAGDVLENLFDHRLGASAVRVPNWYLKNKRERLSH